MLIMELVKLCVKRETEYKLNFVLLCLTVAPLRLMFLLFAVILSDKIELLYGWNKWELAFLYGMYVVSYGLAQVFFRHFRVLDNMIIRGELDQYFVKPQLPIFSLIFYNLHIMELFSQFFPAIVILLCACIKVNVSWSIGKILVLVSSLIGATFIQASIFVIIGCTAVFTFNTNWLGDLYYCFRDFLSYPLSIFGHEMMTFFTYIIPLAFINYYPARFILEKGYIYSVKNFLTLPIGILCFGITMLLWRAACKHYTSAGS